MKNSTRKPEIRFNGFDDDWEQRKFADTFDMLQNNTLSRAELATDSGVARDVHYGDVLIKYGECLPNISELPYIKDLSVVDKYSSSELQNGDVIIADTAEDETVGKCTEMLDINGETVLSGLHTIPCHPKQRFEPAYLGYFMNSSSYHDQLLPLMQGIKVTSISRGSLQDTIICFPSSAEEQAKIGNLFLNIDNLIALHQRKYSQILNIKQSMLEKMFPQNGAKVPEIRFSGFTDDWEQRKLGDLGTVAMNRRIYKDQTTEKGEVPFYKIGTFGGDPDAFISRELFEEYKEKYPYPEKGDILISASGSIGRTVEYTGKDEYFQDSNIVWLKHDQRIDNTFLKYSYSVIKWAGIEGSTIKRLYNDNILNTEISLPSIEEQVRIGAFFKELDNLITLHQRKLDQLKNIKQSCLEKMFV